MYCTYKLTDTYVRTYHSVIIDNYRHMCTYIHIYVHTYMMPTEHIEQHTYSVFMYYMYMCIYFVIIHLALFGVLCRIRPQNEEKARMCSKCMSVNPDIP